MDVQGLAASDPSLGEFLVNIPAAMASGAHQSGEESQLICYLIARSIDTNGSGRVFAHELTMVCRAVFSDRQLRRVLSSVEGQRYWEIDRDYLRLRAGESVLSSFPCDILPNPEARRFPLELLSTRQRRGAALLAAMLTGIDAPRSNAFISRFSRVDRQTVSGWMKDPVITTHILERIPRWSER